MEMQTKEGGNARDFFINLGAIVTLYTFVVSLINLLFAVINAIYPQITDGYSYYARSQSISWPVAILIVSFPIFILLMWLMERQYSREPEKRNKGIHKWLTYLTLFVSGLAIAGGLITVLYYFLDGRELTAGFVLKILALVVVTGCVFVYYIFDVLGRQTHSSRLAWRISAGVVVVGSIIWGFVTLGSPATQRLYKYDEQKINDLVSLNNELRNYYATNERLPDDLGELSSQYYDVSFDDPQTDAPYGYKKTGPETFDICAEFNKSSSDQKYSPRPAYSDALWSHPVGRHCFSQTINPDEYLKPAPWPAR